MHALIHRAAAERFAETAEYDQLRSRYIAEMAPCLLNPPDDVFLGSHLQQAIGMMTQADFARLAPQFEAVVPNYDSERLSALIPSALQVGLWP
jgi:hypothetical protein